MDREPTFPPRLWMPALLLVGAVLWWTRDQDPDSLVEVTAETAVGEPTVADVPEDAVGSGAAESTEEGPRDQHQDLPSPPVSMEPEPAAPRNVEPAPVSPWLDWRSLSTPAKVHLLEQDPFLGRAVELREELRRDPDWILSTTWFSGAHHAPYVLFCSKPTGDRTLEDLLRALHERHPRFAEWAPTLLPSRPDQRPFGLVQDAPGEAMRPASLPFLSAGAGDAMRLPAAQDVSVLVPEVLARHWSVQVQRQHGVHLPWWLMMGAAEVSGAADLASVWHRGGALDLEELFRFQRPEDVERRALTTGDLVQEWALHQEFRATAGSFVAWLVSGADGRQPHLTQAFQDALQGLLQPPAEPPVRPADLWVRVTGAGDLVSLEQAWQEGFSRDPVRYPDRP